MTSQNDTGDHGVAIFAWTALQFPESHQSGRVLRGFNIEERDPVVNSLQETLESSCVNIAAFARRHDLQSETYFQHGDRSRPDRRWGLAVKPRDYFLLRFGTHQFGDYVAIENDHSSKIGGLISKCNSSILKSGPLLGKSAASFVPKPPAGLSSS